MAAVSLTGLARAYSKLAKAPGDKNSNARAATIATSMLDYPWAVQGRGEANTIVMDELGILAKIGAEGVLVMATRQGVSVAIKILDGNIRATTLVGLTLLAAAGAVDIPGVSSVLDKVVDPVLGGGRPVGKIRLGPAVSGAAGLGLQPWLFRAAGSASRRAARHSPRGAAAGTPSDAPAPPHRIATAVRYSLEEVTARAPGQLGGGTRAAVRRDPVRGGPAAHARHPAERHRVRRRHLAGDGQRAAELGGRRRRRKRCGLGTARGPLRPPAALALPLRTGAALSTCGSRYRRGLGLGTLVGVAT